MSVFILSCFEPRTGRMSKTHGWAMGVCGSDSYLTYTQVWRGPSPSYEYMKYYDPKVFFITLLVTMSHKARPSSIVKHK